MLYIEKSKILLFFTIKKIKIIIFKYFFIKKILLEIKNIHFMN